MYSRIIQLLLRAALIGTFSTMVEACFRTSTQRAPTVTPTTSVASTATSPLATSTTPPTTTTTVVPPTPCQSCTLASITLTPGNAVGTATPVPTITRDQNNCLLLTVTCTAPAGQQTFMQFNNNQGGPVQPIGAVVSVQLNCVNGMWVYAPGMGLPSRVITEVNCVNTNNG